MPLAGVTGTVGYRLCLRIGNMVRLRRTTMVECHGVEPRIAFRASDLQSGGFATSLTLHEQLTFSSHNKLAEALGFEPRKGLALCRFSRPVHSTALPNLQKISSVPCHWTARPLYIVCRSPRVSG